MRLWCYVAHGRPAVDCSCWVCQARSDAAREREELLRHVPRCPCDGCVVKRHWTRPIEREVGVSAEVRDRSTR